jgi:STE24 endopeptidase
MATIRRLLCLACVMVVAFAATVPSPARAAETAVAPGVTATAAPSAAPTASGNAESLSPERRAKAIAYSDARYLLYFADNAWSLLVVLVILFSGASAMFRDWGERASGSRLARGAIYQALLIGATAVLDLPTSIVGHKLSLHYDQSIQGWPSWFWDWAKGQFLFLLLGVIWIWIMYAIIRRSPRRWWFYLGLAWMPLLLFIIVIMPVFVAPLFNKFEPLNITHPELVRRIEQVAHHAGLQIAPSRIFEMKASLKQNSVNAYVSGFGKTKRIVVWDTTIAKMTPDEILFVVGHEMGHYVLHHIAKGFVFAALEAFVTFYLAFVGMHWALARWGARWKIRGEDDFASLPVFLLVFGLVQFLLTPMNMAFARAQEHHADIFGLEVIHEIVPDPQDAAVGAFRILGNINLADPDPNPFIRFWLYSHPPMNERIRFARQYDPWARGQSPRFVK